MSAALCLRILDEGLVSAAVLGEAISWSSLNGASIVEGLERAGVPEAHILEWFAGPDAPASDLGRRPVRWVRPPWTADAARRLLAVPIADEDGAIVTLAGAPRDAHIALELRRLTRRRIRLVGGLVSELRDALQAVYGTESRVSPRAGFSLAGKGSDALAAGNARPARGSLPPPSVSRAPSPASGSMELALDSPQALLSWRGLGRAKLAGGAANARSVQREGVPKIAPTPTDDIGSAIATIRHATTTEAVMQALLASATTHARQAFVFRLRGTSLVGLDSAGSSLGAVAVRRIELPLAAGSTPYRVLVEGTPHHGALGMNTTDQVLRVAIGSRGGRLSLHGIWIDARPVGLLVADDVRTGDDGHERLAALSHAASAAMKRMLVVRQG